MVEHPGIVPVYGRGRATLRIDRSTRCFVQGETLQQAIVRFHATHRARLDQRAALELRRLPRHFVDVCNAGLRSRSRAIHRDLKPANIMLGPYGDICGRLGLAKIVGRLKRRPHRLTPPCRNSNAASQAPASAGGTAVGHRDRNAGLRWRVPSRQPGLVDELRSSSDLYGLKAILHDPFRQASGTGNDPETMRQDVLMRRFPRPREVQPGAPAPLEAVCLKAMSLDPQQRYASGKIGNGNRGLDGRRASSRLGANRFASRGRGGCGGIVRQWLGAAAAFVVTIISLSVGMVMLAAVNEQVRALNRSPSSARRMAMELPPARSAVDRYLTQISQDERLKQQDLELLPRPAPDCQRVL